MVFSSLTFLCIFLPVVFILHTVIPNIHIRNALLILASLVFYAYGEPVYVLIMIGSSLVNYSSAFFIAKFEKIKKFILILSLVLNLGTLCIFKYLGFFTESFNSLTGLSIPVPVITLPIGISFFTFQALSYVIDVYRKTVDVQKNYFKVLLYISFFPQLIAGPIVKYRDIANEIDKREIKTDSIARGFRRFICGLLKKVIIANTMAVAADALFTVEKGDLSVLLTWLGALSYLFQIYYDFSGYSDMAIGLGLMFGFKFKENFNYPYSALNIQDFWRRWHISLSTWFKEYLYIPLGGNRKGKLRTVFNRIIVFFFTGLWHGANLTFIIWGLWHGLFLLIEEYVPVLRKLPKVIAHIYTMLIVILGFVVFRADTLSFGFTYIGSMFSGFNISGRSLSLSLEQLTPWFIFVFVIAVVGAAPMRRLSEKIKRNLYGENTLTKGWSIVNISLYVLSLLGLVLCILRLSSGSYNPFISGFNGGVIDEKEHF